MALFGVAGYPPAFSDSKYSKNRLDISDWISDLGLDALELQMTYGPRTTDENCTIHRLKAESNNITLSIHAAYYIVLTTNEKLKVKRSLDTLKRTFEKADVLNSDIIVLHPGPLYNLPADFAMNNFLENISKFFKDIGKTKIGLFVETAGKHGQLGNIDEILKISEAIEGCHPCIDFGHVHAYTLGGLKENSSVDNVFSKLKAKGYFNSKNRIHFHYTPIDYGPKGEITHKSLTDKYPVNAQMDLGFFEPTSNNYYYPRYERIVENLIKHQVNGVVISETYNSQEKGALAMKEFYLKNKKS